MKFLRYVFSVVLIGLLVACGGGGGSAGTTGGTIVTTPTGTTTAANTAADIIVGLDKTTLNNAGSDQVVLSVISVNAAGNKLAGVPITVSVDNFGVFGSLTPLVNGGFATDDTGTFRGAITSPGNKNNRIITALVTSGTAVKSVQIAVIGSAITVTPIPATPSAGDTVNYDVSLKDSGGNAIGGVPLSFGGTFGISTVGSTDLNGNIRVTGTAPGAPGTYTLVVSGSGVTTTRSISVLGTGGVISIPNATTITSGSLNVNLTTIRPNLSNSTLNRAVLTFRMFDNNNQPIPNIRVRFLILPSGLGAGEAISTGAGLVYTDNNGVAQADYISGQRSSANNGVRIRACYGISDAELAGGACPRSADASLTVAGSALNLSIFSNNVIEPVGIGNILYRKTYVVQVVDSANLAVEGAVVSAAGDITHYGKGLYSANYTTGSLAPTINDSPADGTLNTLTDNGGVTTTYTTPGTYNLIDSVTNSTSTVSLRIWCANEDQNRNGVLDANENIDGDNVLEPRASDIVVLPVGTNVSNSTGNVTFQVQWGQNVGSWLAFTLKVTTNVGGSEGTNSTSFVTSFLLADEANGAFRTPPYGRNGCRTNN